MRNIKNTEILKECCDCLMSEQLPIHSLLIWHKGQKICEIYNAPYGREDLHRMFSVTKSITSLAVGALVAKGKLSLEDKICDYFPEFCGEDTHPWLRAMTIEDMLTMQTCHSGTTYRNVTGMQWVESFFKMPPTHPSGKIFMYDTSSSHTLAALVKKMTGKGVLDFLREEFLDEIGFSKEAYILPDPYGSEQGGTGLMARPVDLLLLGRWLLEKILHGTDAYAQYIKSAVDFHVPTVYAAQTEDEKQGYGYQFWQIRQGGFAMYGMGGQYLLIYPDLELIVVTTADLQNISGGNQILLNHIFGAVKRMQGRRRLVIRNVHTDMLQVGSRKYNCLQNGQGFLWVAIRTSKDGGVLQVNCTDTIYNFPYQYDRPVVHILEKYNQRTQIRARLLNEKLLYITAEICDCCIGSIHLVLAFGTGRLTIWMKKVEEHEFGEFQGFLEAVEETGDRIVRR